MKTKHKNKLHSVTRMRISRAPKKQAHTADKAGDMHVNKLEDVGVLNTKKFQLGKSPLTTGRNTCTNQKHHDQSPDPRQASTEKRGRKRRQRKFLAKKASPSSPSTCQKHALTFQRYNKNAATFTHKCML